MSGGDQSNHGSLRITAPDPFIEVSHATRCHAELKRGYAAITHGDDAGQAHQAYAAFLTKWRRLVPEVAVSLEEGGMELLTFCEYPSEMWKSLRTSNVIERLNEEFRRRTKTQGSFPTEEAALTLRYGLLAGGVIRMRKIDGFYRMQAVIGKAETKAA